MGGTWKIKREDVEDILTISPMQEGMLYHYLRDLNSNQYFVQLCLTISGSINHNVFRKAWNFVIETNEMLRSVFLWESLEKPIQVILKKREIEILEYDFSAIQSDEEKNKLVKQVKEANQKKKFKLDSDALFRVSLCKLTENLYEMIISYHHIIYDGWSNGIVLKEFFTAYQRFNHGETSIKISKTKYKEYLKWVQKQDQCKHKQYWQEYLSGFESKTDLPTTHKRTNDNIITENYILKLPKHLVIQLKEFVKDQKITLSGLFYASWAIFLERFNNKEDVIFGVTVSGRPTDLPNVEDMVGLFINTLPLRVKSFNKLTCVELLNTINQSMKFQQNYQYTPLVEVKAYSELDVTSTLFDSILVVENYPLDQQLNSTNSDLYITNYSISEMTNFDLTIGITAFEDIEINFSYNRDLFTNEMIERFANYFMNILSEISANPELRIAQVKMISDTETQQLLSIFNDTKVEYDTDKTIQEWFEEQVGKTPDNVALLFEERELTYRELNNKANQLARILRVKGVTRDDIIGIMAHYSLEMIIGLLGILKAGGAYLPIAADYPQERIQHMLADSDAKILLMQNYLQNKIDFEGETISFTDLENVDETNLDIVNSAKDLAYVIYTSGSTGKPKGVLLEHRNILNYINWRINTYEYTPKDITLQLISFSFDGFGSNLYSSLLSGGTLVLPKDNLDYYMIKDLIAQRKVTNMSIVPSMYQSILDIANPEELATLRFVVLAGESANQELVQKSKTKNINIQLVNEYGPTENSVTTTALLDMSKETINFIGKPIYNNQVYILNRDNTLLPLGAAGELCISGAGLARGYLKRPDLTKEKFVMNPFEIGERMYRTGDLVKWENDGNIRFIGRIDHQVKIRGYRIELGEIENRLLQHEKIRNVVVIDWENSNHDKELCAYYVADSTLEVTELRELLAQELPDYMIPKYYLKLDEMPLTMNGKIDRKALPEVDCALFTEREYIGPTNEIEEELAKIWTEILGIERIGIYDNFFDLGGHSLKVTALVFKIHKRFEIRIPIQQIFDTPTINALATYISRAQKSVYQAIQPIEKREYYPVSSAQKRLLILHQLDEASTSYNTPGAMMIKGSVDFERLESTFKALISRHEALRTSFEYINAEPVQRIHQDVDFKVNYIEANDSEINRCINEFVKPFDLHKALLLRVTLVKLAEKYLLLFDMHHIICDGTSMGIFIRDFIDLYNDISLPDLRIQYKDFAVWQNELLQSEQIKVKEKYWLERFGDEIPQCSLPTDYPRSFVRSFAGDVVHFKFDQIRKNKLEQLVAEQGVTVYMLLLGIYYLLLEKYSNTEDIIVGSPITGREHADLEPIIGMFVNTLAMRNQPVGVKTFTAFLTEVKENALQAYQNQEYQFEMLVDRLDLARDLRKNPLFDTMFILQNTHLSEIHLQNLIFTPYELKNQISKFDLSLNAVEVADEIHFDFEYCTDLFKRETIERLASHFIRIYDVVVDNPDIQIAEIEMLSENEKYQLISQFNATQSEVPASQLLHHLFEIQVEKTPDNIAITFEEKQLSYHQLNEKANQLARLLVEKGIKSDNIVGLMVERSLEMIIGIMGILKAGGAYLPIDPTYPEERIQYMLNNSNVQILLAQPRIINPTLEISAEIIDLTNERIFEGDSSNLNQSINPSDLAYVIYTSGSTGNPKGVMIEHHNVVNTIYWRKNEYQLDVKDRVLQLFSFSFDGFVTGFFTPIVSGSEIILPTDDAAKDALAIKQLIVQKKVTHFIAVPSLYSAILECMTPEDAKSLEIVTLAGEQIPTKLIAETCRLNPDLELVNEYGPTENSVATTIFRNIQSVEKVVIGHPIANTQVYILDRYHKLVPVGIPGELCIAGEGLARGYLNRPDLTVERFIDHPFTPGKRMYETGDLAKWLPDGNIEFLGRIDHQVKIRGFRIEIEEIEAQLLKHEEIEETIVIAKEDANDNKYLVAYIVAKCELKVTELKEFLARSLPGYMIPSFYVHMAKMPLTPNGKVNRKALPEPAYSVGREYVAPENEVEERLAKIWSEVLGIQQVGVTDNFFDLGGHSLKATFLISQVFKHFDVELPLKEIFKTPTIKAQAQLISQAEAKRFYSIAQVEKRDFYPLSSAQMRLYILNQLEGTGTTYNMPGAFKIVGTFDRERLETAFQMLIKRHEVLRTSFELVEGEPVQKIHQDVEFSISNIKAAEGELAEVIKEFIRPFDLRKPPLLRVGVVSVGQEHVLLVDLHHIIADGYSMGVLFKEFSQAYDGQELPKLTIQYKDFTVWQNNFRESQEMKKQEEYWLERFRGEVPLLNMPTDFVRPSIKSFAGDRVYFEAEGELRDCLNELASSSGATLYMVLLTAYSILLSKYAGQNDIVIGTPIAGRQHADLENVLGMFVNTLAIRNKLNQDQTVSELLGQVRDEALEAFGNQDYQFETLVDQLHLTKNLSRNPIFDTMFTLQNALDVELHLQDFTLIPYDFDFKVAKFDLTLNVVELEEKLRFELEYCIKLFKRKTIEQIAGHFLKILKDIVKNPDQKISEMELLLESEKQKLLYEFNNTNVSCLNAKTITQMFEEVVEKNSEQIAVVYEDQCLTYRELNEKANQLGRYLRAQGVHKDQIVGIMLERSVELVVGFLGVLKAGGAYLPIDPEYPAARIEYVLRDSEAKILLTREEFATQINFSGQIIEVTEQQIYTGDNANIVSLNDSTDLAYIIYTSGTTGRPKGVMVEHKGIENLHLFFEKDFGVNEKDRIIQFASASFDASVWETYMALLSGATLYMLNKDVINDYHHFEDYLNTNQITIATLPPIYLSNLNPDNIQSMRIVITAGSATNAALVNRWKERVMYINAYGPTESTICATTWKEEVGEYTSIPIGRPIYNTQVYIVDENLHLAPIGVVGELCIGSIGLARGYVNRPDLTETKFIENPFLPGGKIYKTGDLARWLADGNIEFLGRIDNQVKVRGFRIELGEIENQLLSHEAIKEGIVIDREVADGDKVLCAYFVSDVELATAELKSFLSQELPEYMIPSYFIRLEKMPLTPNGKVDRKALLAYGDIENVKREYVAPRNETELRLQSIWSDILGIEKIGITENFFELGGHSLKATSLSSKIKREFQVEVSLEKVFRMPTIQELAAYILQTEKSVYATIEPVEETAYYPVSSAQKRMYVLNQLEKQSVRYNMPTMMLIKGELERERFAEAFKKVIHRHESLRTSFDSINGEIVQKIQPTVEFTIIYQEARKDELAEIIAKFIQPFDLTQAPLLRVGLVKVAEEYLLMTDMHHIISDGVSMSILTQDFVQFYNGMEMSSLRIQYKDFTIWQNEFFQEQIQKQETYWLNRLASEIPVLDLPTDEPRPVEMSYEGDRISFTLTEQLREQLNELALQNGVTLYIALLAIYNVFLLKYTGQEDIIVGSPIAGRDHADLENIIGMFVNTLALRNYPVREKEFTEFLAEVKVETLQAYENQDYPFEMLVERLELARDLSRNPVFDTLFVMQNINELVIEIGDLQLKPYDFENKISKFDLTFNASETVKELTLGFEYRTSLFRQATIERMVSHLLNIIQQVVTNPHATLADIEMISAKEKEELLVHFCGQMVDYPRELTISELFEMQVKRTPEKIAVVDDEQRISYRELNAKANQLARVLRAKGVKADQTVAIMAERSVEMIIGVLAIVKAGGTYLPIDLDYPQERVGYMLEDTGTHLLLTQFLDSNQDFFAGECIDLSAEELYVGDSQNLQQINQPTDLIYVIYTSGSTGNPKGVMIEHRNVNRLVSNSNMLVINQNDRILQTGSLAFDASTFEIWGALLNGASLYLTSKENILSPDRFAEKMKEYQITKMWLTAPLFNQLLESNSAIFAELETLYVGGDALSPKHISQLRRQNEKVNIINGYGPTENTTFTTFFKIDQEYTYNIPIGQPVNNTQVYILDKADKLQPIGISGELCITGDGLARGYLHHPELTAEKFVENPFNLGEKMYRTGDMVRWLSDGKIEFIGRIDHQVKIRGFRIELGEIENYLLTHSAIKEAVVLDRKDAQENKYLCAYYVADVELSATDLRSYLKKDLPDYMIPTHFVQLEQLPLTSNGKVNRKALPEPEGNIITGEYIAPRTEVEEKLTQIWSEVLGIPQVGINDNFFDLGGDSIKAIKIVAEANQVNLNITVKDLFKYKSIAEIIDNVDYSKQSEKISQAEVKGEVLLTPIQKWFFAKKLSYPQYWNQTNLFSLRDDVDLELLEKAFKKVIEHHDALRMGYRFGDEQITQFNRGNEEIDFKLGYVDLSNDSTEHQNEQIKRLSEEIQVDLNLETDLLIKGVVFDLGVNGKRLFIPIHHLLIDGISWRIFLEDLEFLYNSNLQTELPLKTTSYQDWSSKLHQFAEKEVLDIEYWEDIDHSSIESISKIKVTDNCLKEHQRKSFILDEDRTDQLLTKINWAYNTEINDILLAALTLALSEVTGRDKVCILLEGHGREELLENVVITRTIGWFTNIYPVCLQKEEDLEKTIVQVKDQLRRVPCKGMNFGIARYLQMNEHLQNLNPEISFNYLGQMDGIVSMEQTENVGLLSIAHEEIGLSIHGDNQHATLLDVTGMVVNGKLQMGFNYNSRYITDDWMEQLTLNYQEKLIEIIEQCLHKDEQRYTVSDLEMEDIWDDEDLEMISDLYEL